jgi:hypothetical protein
MAKIIEDTLIIKFSKIVKDNDTVPDVVLSIDNINAIEQVAQELVGDGTIVEIQIQQT